MTIEKTQKFHLVQVGGASFVEKLPLFSHDGKFLFCPCGSAVNVFSTNTGECVHKLVCEGTVSAIAQHPNNKLQLISATKTGMLQMWDYEDGILLKSVNVSSSIMKLFCDPNIKNWAFVVENEKTGVLKRVFLPISKNDKNFQEIASNISARMSQPVGSLKSGRYIVFLKRKDICVINLEKVTESVNHEAVTDGRVTCFACHPQEDCIATGHRKGEIRIWHKLCPVSGKKTPLVVSTVHWHHNPLTGLSFTPGGSSLLSVSLESVLVQWHYKVGNKQSFLPRLGSPCNHVVTTLDGTMYATTHSDNSVSIISNEFSVKHTIQGLTSAKGGNSCHRIFQYEPRTRSCVTLGKRGHLVFYDPAEDREVYSLDITHENFISGDPQTDGAHAQITRVANQGDDKSDEAWMATMETSTIEQDLVESRLKFWKLSQADKWWRLNTVINHPHSKDVTRLCFRPMSSHSSQPYMVSTGADGMVKLWGFQQSTCYWSCIATASYQEMPATYCDFSQDGSVLAAAFGHMVLLLDPVTLETTSVIQSLEKKEPIEKLVFGRHSCQQMIIIQSTSCVQGYDLLNGVLAWIADMIISHIAVDPFSEFMYMLSKSSDLFVIRPSSSELVYAHKNIGVKNVISMVCVPHSNSFRVSDDACSSISWMAQSRLYLADTDLSVFTLTRHTQKQQRRLSKAKKSEPSHFITPMAHILDKRSNVDDEPVQSSDGLQVGRPDSNALKMITDSPAHVLPSIVNHCGDFLASFLEVLHIDEPKIPKTLYDPQVQTAVGPLDYTASQSSSRMVESTNCSQPRAMHMKFLNEIS